LKRYGRLQLIASAAHHLQVQVQVIECCIPYSEIYLFADDAKLFRHITQDSDKTALQKGVNALQEWTQEWFLKLTYYTRQ